MTMTIKSATWSNEPDLAFDMKRKAEEACRIYGEDKVINSVLGTLADDEGRIIAFPSVYKALDDLARGEIASYAPIEGDRDYLDKLINILFDDYKPDAYIKAVASPGGTGAIRSALWTYVDKGDPVLCHNYCWGVYQTMCQEFGRDFRTYEFFNEDFSFNLDDLTARLDEALGDSDRTAIIINSPANNPTGYSLSDREWDLVIDLLKDRARDKDKKLTLLVDVAYLEYAGDGKSQREFFTKFSNLPENLMVVVCFSMSKAYTAYGMRCGAAVGISSSQKAIEDFENSFTHTARANWSNVNHAPQKILVRLSQGDDLEAYKKDLEDAKDLLNKRAEVFIRETRQNDIRTIPYFGGFFAFIPTDRAFEISDKLEKDHIFVLPQTKGLRIALCRTPARLIPDLVQGIKKYI
ncbi:MAG: aminotransferase class I/II-fold pyridoxal phosphate-dependent enzyme [Peptoniphilaceae bacterium]|nr:aminotransferase class I/II-fold pyridoxal phosphate-dependent enzyme [Anaerococcus sp.]MDD7044549.1 aminotransferase class I/II-fold pyridoxal phosphate-dependent enzyme [Peptoniphilaceae bacterium]